MSRTFSTNSGSVDSLKVSTRCGCSPKARQMRCTVDGAWPISLPCSSGSSACHPLVASPASCGSCSRSRRRRSRAARRPRLVVETVHPVVGEAVAPCADRVRADPQLRRDLLVLEAAGRRQHNARPLCHRLRRAVLARQCRQLALLHVIEYDRDRSSFAIPVSRSKGRRECNRFVDDALLRTIARVRHTLA